MRTTETDRIVSVLPSTFPTFQLLYPAVHAGRKVSLHRQQTLLGREVNDDDGVALPEDGRASRQHARVELIDSRLTNELPTVRILDLDSKNGTFVNGHPVKDSRLVDGDVIRIGNALLLLRIEPVQRTDVPVETLLGNAPTMRMVRRQLAEAAPSAGTVLLCGETGSGKELAAQALHRLSGRSGPLISVNCAAIPSELAESELFGHVEGAFSGARRTHSGYFRAAQDGTLFLDEVGELPAVLQPKLLRALELHEVTPVGSTKSLAVNVRVVAATNRTLPDAVRLGQFRDDLYARLRGTEITMPPLRVRREDILPLLESRLRAALSGQLLRLTPRLAEALILYHWPHNVRELVQLAELLSSQAKGGHELDLPLVADRLRAVVGPAGNFPPELFTADKPTQQMPSEPLPAEVDPDELRLSRDVLERLAKENNWNVSKLARLVGRSRRQVRRWLGQHGLQRDDDASN